VRDVSCGSDRSTTGDQLQDDHDERHEEQEVNEAGGHVERHEAHGPQHDEYDGDSPKHDLILFPGR
jgi:hypothetical protein